MRFIYLVGENKDGFYCDVTSEMSPCCVNCLRSCAVRPSGRRNYDLLIHYVRIWILDCWFDKKKAIGRCPFGLSETVMYIFTIFWLFIDNLTHGLIWKIISWTESENNLWLHTLIFGQSRRKFRCNGLNELLVLLIVLLATPVLPCQNVPSKFHYTSVTVDLLANCSHTQQNQSLISIQLATS